MRAKMWVSLGVLLYCCAISCVMGFAEEKFEQEAFREIKGVALLVDEVGKDAEGMGLTKKNLQQEIELKLRKAGIKVLTVEEWFRAPDADFFCVHVHTMKTEDSDDSYAYSISVELGKSVVLVADKASKTLATVWKDGPSTGTLKKSEMLQLVSLTGERVSEFLKEYEAANGTKKQEQ